MIAHSNTSINHLTELYSQPGQGSENDVDVSPPKKKTGWESFDLVEIAQKEYISALNRLKKLRAQAEANPSKFSKPDATLDMAEVEVKRAARILEMIKELSSSLPDRSDEAGAPPDSPTYSEFGELPQFEF